MEQRTLLQAISLCEKGGVIAYPAETVYGLGCLPGDEDAVNRVLELKNRSVKKGLILVADNISQILQYVDFSRVSNMQAIEDSWPGPFTWLVPIKKDTPKWLSGNHNTLAVRVSVNPTIRFLCKELGPIVSTSANPQDYEPARSSKEVQAYFPDQIDYIVPGNITGTLKPTEIKDAISGHVIRSA